MFFVASSSSYKFPNIKILKNLIDICWLKREGVIRMKKKLEPVAFAITITTVMEETDNKILVRKNPYKAMGEVRIAGIKHPIDLEFKEKKTVQRFVGHQLGNFLSILELQY